MFFEALQCISSSYIASMLSKTFLGVNSSLLPTGFIFLNRILYPHLSCCFKFTSQRSCVMFMYYCVLLCVQRQYE